eukprot:10622238-Prorocentrum_lima.AAC.1
MSRRSQDISPRRQLPTRSQAAGAAMCTTIVGSSQQLEQQFASQVHEVVECHHNRSSMVRTVTLV